MAIPAANVKSRSVRWLWQGRIPRGELTVLAGDPGLGKSLLTVRLAADLTRGRMGRGGKALLLTAEDSREHAVRPRLEAAGADLEQVFFGWVNREGLESALLLPEDVDRLSALVERCGPALVVIDPLSAHLGRGVNSWKDQEVRRALAPLNALAKRSGAAIVVVAHLNKGQSMDPIQRLGGSVGIPAAARSVLLLARDPDDPEGGRGSQRVLAHVKCNLAPLALGLRYEIEAVAVPVATDETVTTATMVERGFSPCTGRDLLTPPRVERGEKLREAMTFLTEELAGGPVPVREVKETALEKDISEQTLKRAKERLGVKSNKLDFGGGWAWLLPEMEASDPS